MCWRRPRTMAGRIWSLTSPPVTSSTASAASAPKPSVIRAWACWRLISRTAPPPSAAAMAPACCLSALSYREARVPPYRSVHIRHQRQQSVTNIIRKAGSSDVDRLCFVERHEDSVGSASRNLLSAKRMAQILSAHTVASGTASGNSGRSSQLSSSDVSSQCRSGSTRELIADRRVRPARVRSRRRCRVTSAGGGGQPAAVASYGRHRSSQRLPIRRMSTRTHDGATTGGRR